jgi:hypothetical protein
LDPEQNRQLAALSRDILFSLEVYNDHRRDAGRAYKLAGEGERRTRMLSRKVAKLREQLGDLQDYAKELDPLLGTEHVRAADRSLKDLENLNEDVSAGERYRLLKSKYPTLEDPAQLGMVQLYWLFRHECGLTGDEAEVRVALLRNGLWTEHGVECVQSLREAYSAETAESMGCDAVHVAVTRYRWD